MKTALRISWIALVYGVASWTNLSDCSLNSHLWQHFNCVLRVMWGNWIPYGPCSREKLWRWPFLFVALRSLGLVSAATHTHCCTPRVRGAVKMKKEEYKAYLSFRTPKAPGSFRGPQVFCSSSIHRGGVGSQAIENWKNIFDRCWQKSGKPQGNSNVVASSHCRSGRSWCVGLLCSSEDIVHRWKDTMKKTTFSILTTCAGSRPGLPGWRASNLWGRGHQKVKQLCCHGAPHEICSIYCKAVDAVGLSYLIDFTKKWQQNYFSAITLF